MSKLIRNAVKCKHCNDTIESKHRHDFVWCSCGKVAVDGGLDYCKVMFPDGQPSDHMEDLCEYKEESL